MNQSTDRILTTHGGRLFGSPDLEGGLLNGARPFSDESLSAQLLAETTEAVQRQAEIGLDVISDGEIGKGVFYPYYSQRIDGLSQRELKDGEAPVTVLRSREREAFPGYYGQVAAGQRGRLTTKVVATGPLTYKGAEAIEQELALFRQTLEGTGVEEAFFPVLAPGWIDHFVFNEHYSSDEEWVFALADVLKHEYRAVVDAGFLLQVDDPGIADAWPTFFPEPTVDEYRRYAGLRVEALNHALDGIPEERVRYHVCWGSHHGPHVEDVPLEHIVDLVLHVNAQGYLIEAANVRHEHEAYIWQDGKLPEGKLLIPGVVTHATNLVEHPELVASRIVRWANLVGRENIIAGTDCGMGTRIHPELGWAKLEALVQGAQLATERLWA